MNKNINEDYFISLEDCNLSFSIETKESFLLDVNELVQENFIKLEEVNSKVGQLVKKINSILLSNSEDPNNKENLVYKKFKNRYEFSLDEQIFNFEFYYNKKEDSLVFTHFDKLIEDNNITPRRDLFLFIFELLVIFSLVVVSVLNKSVKLTNSLIFVFVLPISNIVLYILAFISSRKKNYTIWMNQNSIDLYRKLYRSKKVSNLNQMYYFISWLNAWYLCTIMLSIPIVIKKNLHVLIYLAIFIIVLSLMFYSAGYILKMFRLTYWNLSISSVLIFLIGFINKDYWAFIALLFVIVNQLLSKDILYLSKRITSDEIQKMENGLNTYANKANEIRLKFQTNIAIACVYLFIIFHIKPIFSEIIITILKLLNNDIHINLCPGDPIYTMAIGIERIIILILFVNFLRTDKYHIPKLRKQIINQIQIIIDFIVERLFKNRKLSVPIFKNEISVYPNEELIPSDVIINIADLPSDIKVVWQDDPNKEWINDINNKKFKSEVLVIYPDRSCYKTDIILNKVDLH